MMFIGGNNSTGRWKGYGGVLPLKARAWAAAVCAALVCHQLAVGQVSRLDVQAASDAAVRGLKDQVDRLPITPKLTVGQYLDSVNAHNFMLATLQRAQLIGGPRPMDDRTVQVRLDITGKVVADTLSHIAGLYQLQSKVPPRLIVDSTRAWSGRTFTATGSSSGLVVGSGTFDPRVARRADPGDAAAMVQTAPREGVDAAKRSVAGAAIGKLAEAQLPEGRKGSELVAIPGVSEALTQQVMGQPVEDVRVQPDGEVRLVVLMDRLGLFEVLKSAALRSGDPATPADEAVWSTWRDPLVAAIPERIEGVALPAGGTGAAASNRAPAVTDSVGRVNFSTDRPPAWFFSSIDATATAPFAGSKLRTARAAEVNARALLSEKLGQLELPGGVMLADAAKVDPRYAQPIGSAVQRSRVFRVEYREDGSAEVRISTDTREFWQDLVRLAY
jgi:hypothetical protein